jgi:hypothetical protein
MKEIVEHVKYMIILIKESDIMNDVSTYRATLQCVVEKS